MLSIFDLSYYGLSVVMLGTLGYTAVAGFALRPALSSPRERNEAVGVSLAALGALLTLVSGVVFTDLDRAGLLNDLLYQQAHFSLFYMGFALILFGVIATASRWPLLLWLGFAVTCVIAATFLFNPDSYTYTQSGTRVNAVQQVVFYLPLFSVTAAGVLPLPFRATRAHLHPVWFAIFCAAILVGLLAAFVPFFVGTVCLLLTVRSLAAEAAAKKAHAMAAQVD